MKKKKGLVPHYNTPLYHALRQLQENVGTVDSIHLYLQEVGSHELLDAHEEAMLSQKSIQGDQSARWTLMVANLRLVLPIAAYYAAATSSSAIDLLDLIQEGNIGLIRALERYDPTRSRLSTHAAWLIWKTVR